MKKLYFVFFALVSISCYAQGFRSIPWQTNMESVISVEGSDFISKTSNVLEYKRYLFGHLFITRFEFNNNLLDGGRYYFSGTNDELENYTDKGFTSYAGIFEMIVSNLKAKYNGAIHSEWTHNKSYYLFLSTDNRIVATHDTTGAVNIYKIVYTKNDLNWKNL